MLHYKSVFVLGRQPVIGWAELESLYGAEVLEPLDEFGAASSLLPTDIDFARLGSTVKLGEVLGIIDATEWRAVQQQLTALAVQRAQDLSEGKIQLGISTYGLRVAPRQLTAAGLELKKALRNAGYSVRLVPNQEELALSSAQVLHNHLSGERGLELLLIRHHNQTVVARTTNVQDITAYARRDQGRPKRDAFVGMLPPKLAQTIINLATGPLPPREDTVVLDPFCGTGVILQEALLMGYGAYGTDLEPRMIDYSRENLAWLSEHVQSTSGQREPSTSRGDSAVAEPGKILGDSRLQSSFTAHERSLSSVEGGSPKPLTTHGPALEVLPSAAEVFSKPNPEKIPRETLPSTVHEAKPQTEEIDMASAAAEFMPALETGDATTHQWSIPFTVIASETYLGRPLNNWPAPGKLQEITGTCNVIVEHFLRNIAAQTPCGTRLCLAVPAWRNPNGRVQHLSTLDRLSDLGYNRVSFSGVRNEDLVYYRPDQLVARELLVIIRK